MFAPKILHDGTTITKSPVRFFFKVSEATLDAAT